MTDDVVLGTIRIDYVVPGDGEPPQVWCKLPEFTEIPVVVQLGMLELARDSILKTTENPNEIEE